MINSHRLLVRGHRIPYLPTTAGPLEKVAETQTQNMFLLGSLVVGITLLVLFVLTRLVLDHLISRRNYEVALTIQNDKGLSIPNVPFELLNARGNKSILDEEGKPITLTSNNHGEMKATNLNGGQYTLRNKAEDLNLQLKVKRMKQSTFKTTFKKKHPRWQMIKADEGGIIARKRIIIGTKSPKP